MELDDFKKKWKAQVDNEFKTHISISKKIKDLTMNTTGTLAELTHTNTHWWKTIKTTMILLLSILGINLLLYFIVPEKFQHIENAFPYFAIIVSFALISIALYYVQFKIFDVDISLDLKSALEKAIRQFNKFYLLYNIIYLLLFPVLFYFVIKVSLRLFQIELSFSTGAWLSGALTVICLVINHFYYKKKYFKRIIKLKDNLKELTGGSL